MLASSVATLLDNSIHGEDNHLTRDLGNNTFLDAVMDGVTGHGGGEASRSLVEALAEAPIKSAEDVVELLAQVNDEFYQAGGGRFLLTTVSAALFLNDRLYVIGAGDSPVYLIKPDSVEQLSGRVGGFLHVGVARAIGASPRLDNLSRTDVAVVPGTRLVLATDGLSDNLHTDELAEMVRRAYSAEEAAEEVNSVIATRIKEGRVPELLGRRFRHDDRTAIFRFFNSD